MTNVCGRCGSIRSAAFDPFEERAVVRVTRPLLVSELCQALRLFEVTEARNTVCERANDLVVLGLELVRASKVTLRSDGVVERNVHEVTEVVVVPGRLRREV